MRKIVTSDLSFDCSCLLGSGAAQEERGLPAEN